MRDAILMPFEKLKPVAALLKGCRFEFQLAAVAFGMFSATAVSAQSLKLELPTDCKIGETCFFQNFADLDPSDQVSDPWCGKAAYDGHKGTDIRLRSSLDIEQNVQVTASAGGIVKSVRDGEPDKLILTDADKAGVSGKECGNGVVIAHEGGYETQYCHLKQGSVVVAEGQSVAAGDALGAIGASGLTQFPHVHLSLRKDGEWIDPVSGRKSGEACGDANKAGSYFSANAYDQIPAQKRQLLGAGLSGSVVEHQQLTQQGFPDPAKTTDSLIVGWVWLINLEAGDRLKLSLVGPDGPIANNAAKPFKTRKASYSAYTGVRQAPVSGEYKILVEVINNDETVFETRIDARVE